MKGTNAIAIGLVLSSFALLGTWAGSVGDVKTSNASLLAAASESQCPFEDQTSGVGGQSGECEFACEGGFATLSVSADDPDAWATGSATCNGRGELHCSEEHSCSDESVTTSAGAGLCSGDTDEMWDSGIYVNCSSRARDAHVDEIGVPKKEVCPVSFEPSPPYPRICIPLGSGSTEAGLRPFSACLVRERVGSTLCESDRGAEAIVASMDQVTERILRTFRAENHTISAHLFVGDGVATGLVCWGFDCKQVLPAFENGMEGQTRWSVS